MDKYGYKYCVVGKLTARQKIMATRLLRADFPVMAMDEYNAETQDLSKKAEKIVLFCPYSGMDPTGEDLDMVVKLGWSVSRISVEGEDFDFGDIPS